MTSDPYDRTIHAKIPDGGMIVRYNKAGKWYLEYPPQTGRPRRKLTLAEAVDLALKHETDDGCRIYMNYAGGTTFDARVRRLKRAKENSLRMRDANPLKRP